MRLGKLTISLLSLLWIAQSIIAQGTTVGTQWESKRWMITSGTGYATWQSTTQNSVPICGLEYIPTTGPCPLTGKYPVMIFLHGVGEKGGYNSATLSMRADTMQNAGPTTNDASCDALYTTSPFSLLKTTSGALWHRMYFDPYCQTSHEVAWIGIQCWGDDQTASAWGWFQWAPIYVQEVIKQRIKGTYASVLDETRIGLTGLSYGGGGSFFFSQDSVTCSDLNTIQPICGGYQDDNWAGYPFLSRSGVPMRIFHATNDNTTGGAGNSMDHGRIINNPVDGLGALKTVEQYIFTTGDHTIWDRLYNPANWNTDYDLTNGGVFNSSVNKNIVEFNLMFRNDGQRRPDLR